MKRPMLKKIITSPLKSQNESESKLVGKKQKFPLFGERGIAAG